MGIPALFRWLTQKYPKITVPVVEEKHEDVSGIPVPIDCTQPNPNDIEFDNLYLDMNGIIHPCCHPEDKPAPKTEDEMYIAIFDYIDRIMRMIRPRKVLYMAIDGVAPRAKMNQQRSRRFRAAKEAHEKAQDEERLLKEWEAEHGKVPEQEEKQKFDSNCITPGTPFMTKLAVSLKYYIASRLDSDPAWKNLKVILSDASVPGEGEHKIMDYIRRQRGCPEYNPQTHHVLYGLDADLIMLALATHEPNFHILREDVFFNQKSSGCFICGQQGHLANQCTGKAKEKKGENDEIGNGFAERPYVFLRVHVLREYLEIELQVSGLSFPYDFERAIDDYVFLCFFVGNDFLPHLPSLEIREGAVDRLIEIWKRNLYTFGGYLTDSGDIDLGRVQVLMEDLGKMEDDIFKKRKEDEERRKQNAKRRKEQEKTMKEQRKVNRDAKSVPAIVETMGSIPFFNPKGMTKQDRAQINRDVIASRNSGVTWGDLADASKTGKSTAVSNKAAAQMLKAQLSGTNNSAPTIPTKESDVPQEEEFPVVGVKRKADEIENGDEKETNASPIKLVEKQDVFVAVTTVQEEMEEEDSSEDDAVVSETDVIDLPPITENPTAKKDGKEEEEEEEQEPVDDVRLWEPGWKKRYYKNKFEVDENNIEFRRQVVTSYVEGLCWVLKYYYQGCQSWQWYFPYHYSPFASDFDFIGSLEIKFTLGKPFRPYDQLMGVLPAASRSHIPPAFQSLMINIDSEILDFYPEDFPIDLNGKKHAWQGVALLPFIEEKRLLNALEKRYDFLADDEKARNERGEELVWLSGSHPSFESVCLMYARPSDEAMELDCQETEGMFGYVKPDPLVCLPGSIFFSPLAELGLRDITKHHCVSAIYLMPAYPDEHIFKATLLSNVVLPKRILDADDYHFITSGVYNQRQKRHRSFYTRVEGEARYIKYNNNNNSNNNMNRNYQDRNGRNEDRGGYHRNNRSYDDNRNNSGYHGRYNKMPRRGGYGDGNGRYNSYDRTQQSYNGQYEERASSYGGYQNYNNNGAIGRHQRDHYQQQSYNRQGYNNNYNNYNNRNQQYSQQRGNQSNYYQQQSSNSYNNEADYNTSQYASSGYPQQQGNYNQRPLSYLAWGRNLQRNQQQSSRGQSSSHGSSRGSGFRPGYNNNQQQFQPY